MRQDAGVEAAWPKDDRVGTPERLQRPSIRAHSGIAGQQFDRLDTRLRVAVAHTGHEVLPFEAPAVA